MTDRKNAHIDICLKEEVEFSAAGDGANGFASYRFDHDALPEVDKSKIDLSVTVLGKRLSAPIFVGAMTGGTERAGELNKRLAIAAARCGVGFALGSQRKMLDGKDSAVRASYAVREFAPKLPLLIGNLGAVQLNYGASVDTIRRLVEDVGCDAFNFHLNPLQEAIQPEGDTNFAGLIAKLGDAIPKLGVPVLLKEVGSGISETTATKVKALPIAGIETAGSGGTSWSKIESYRTNDPVQRTTGELFARWGIPTAESVVNCRRVFPDKLVIASGGMRNGIEAAKAIALGADAAGYALPILKAAEQSVEAAEQAIQQIIEELRTAMFVTGCAKVSDLKTKKLARAMDFSTR